MFLCELLRRVRKDGRERGPNDGTGSAASRQRRPSDARGLQSVYPAQLRRRQLLCGTAFAANIPTINRQMAEARVFDEYEIGEPVAPAPIIERPPFDSLHLCRREDETVGVFTLPARGATRGLWLYARENGRVLQQGLAHIVRAFAETAVWVASRADGRARE